MYIYIYSNNERVPVHTIILIITNDIIFIEVQGDSRSTSSDNPARSRQVSLAESVPDTILSDYEYRSRQVSQSGFLPRVQSGLVPSFFSLPATTAASDHPFLESTTSYCEPSASPAKRLNDDPSSISMEQIDENQRYNPWRHPLSLYAVAITVAWGYIIIPVTSFWEFALV